MPSPDAVNNVWGQTAPMNLPELHTLPSGQVVKAKRIGVEGLVLAGVLGEGDELTKLVQQRHLANKPASAAMNLLMNDPGAFGKLVLVIDRAMPLIVVEPQVRLHLVDLANGQTKMIPPEEREEGVIYTDQIPLPDKVELMNFGVGSVASLARFREQSPDPVAAVVDGPSVPVPAKRPSQYRKGRTGKPPRIRD